ncbi:MAG: nucleotidyltransferase domain-containing protein [Elusimicrobia bacterium]|nr:nucleotidyltransferase domain-containing protein [Elusimicrobiota bacterium]
MGHAPARVLKAFADAGLFETGAVLIGTHAFGLMGNLLGARWKGSHLQTQDLDSAAMALVAVVNESSVDAPGALERLEMGFLPVPGLDSRRPSTSFKVRGGSPRVDFLTPGRGEKPVELGRLGTYAHPLPYLDFLIENPERAVILDAGGFLTLIPSPARFALHKLIIAHERLASEHAKTEKDLSQATEVISFLAQARPGDLRLAADALRRRKWMKKLTRVWGQALKRHPELAPAGERIGF